MKKRFLILFALILCLIAGWFFFDLSRAPKVVAPVPEPQPSAIPDGAPSKANLIRVTNPVPGAVIKSPITVEGEARGYWFFEASFPVLILDANGKTLAQLPAQAGGEWMTEQFVPFSATAVFETPTTDTGVIVLRKDNPSGDPARDDELRIPVRFR